MNKKNKKEDSWFKRTFSAVGNFIESKVLPAVAVVGIIFVAVITGGSGAALIAGGIGILYFQASKKRNDREKEARANELSKNEKSEDEKEKSFFSKAFDKLKKTARFLGIGGDTPSVLSRISHFAGVGILLLGLNVLTGGALSPFLMAGLAAFALTGPGCRIVDRMFDLVHETSKLVVDKTLGLVGDLIRGSGKKQESTVSSETNTSKAMENVGGKQGSKTTDNMDEPDLKKRAEELMKELNQDRDRAYEAKVKAFEALNAGKGKEHFQKVMKNLEQGKFSADGQSQGSNGSHAAGVLMSRSGTETGINK